MLGWTTSPPADPLRGSFFPRAPLYTLCLWLWLYLCLSFCLSLSLSLSLFLCLALSLSVFLCPSLLSFPVFLSVFLFASLFTPSFLFFPPALTHLSRLSKSPSALPSPFFPPATLTGRTCNLVPMRSSCLEWGERAAKPSPVAARLFYRETEEGGQESGARDPKSPPEQPPVTHGQDSGRLRSRLVPSGTSAPSRRRPERRAARARGAAGAPGLLRRA